MKENTEGYIHHFARFSGPRYNGSLIVRLHYQRLAKTPAHGHFEARLMDNHSRSQKLAVEGWNEKQQTGRLCIELFFPHQAAVIKREMARPLTEAEKPPAGALPWHSFTAREIQEFSLRTGDPNPIHLGERPIVQGLLLWQQVFKTLQEPQELHMLFHAPVHADEAIYLKEETVNEQNEHVWLSCCQRASKGRSVTAEPPSGRGLCRAFKDGGVLLFTAAFASF